MTVRAGNWMAALALLPATLSAQTVRGTVVERVDGVPVVGAIVLLMDNAGVVVHRALTNERGEFRVSAPAAGLYRLRTLRIGFLPAISAAISLRAGQELEMSRVVAGAPVSLDTVRVVGRNACRLHGDSAVATYALWEQVRTALMAAELTTATRAMSATLVTFERHVSPHTGDVQDQEFAVRSGFSSRAWGSLSADSLRRVGYVARGPDRLTTYNAPDLTVLLSTAFLEDHCLRLATVSRGGRVGLAFEPTPDRSRIPEIRGTIWLDRASAELREMEFRYTNVMSVEQRSEAGGEMTFVRMPHGAWAISRWFIRMPVLEYRITPSPLPGLVSREETLVRSIKLAGGELALVTRGPDTLWSRPPHALNGTVVDSASGRAIPGARVSLNAVPRRATSDSSGRFSLPNVPAGKYVLDVRAPAPDSTSPSHRWSFMFADSSESIVVRVPSPSPVPVVNADVAAAPRPSRPSSRLDSVYARSEPPTIPEFEDRRAKYRGRFFTREEIEGKRASRLSDLLTGTVGLRIFVSERGEAYATSGRGRVTIVGDNPECLAHVYVDGAMVYAGGSQPPFNLNTLSADQLEAIEYYGSGGQIPPEFNRPGVACGLLILWSRRR